MYCKLYCKLYCTTSCTLYCLQNCTLYCKSYFTEMSKWLGHAFRNTALPSSSPIKFTLNYKIEHIHCTLHYMVITWYTVKYTVLYTTLYMYTKVVGSANLCSEKRFPSCLSYIVAEPYTVQITVHCTVLCNVQQFFTCTVSCTVHCTVNLTIQRRPSCWPIILEILSSLPPLQCTAQ